jgi:hypothetical protein
VGQDAVEGDVLRTDMDVQVDEARQNGAVAEVDPACAVGVSLDGVWRSDGGDRALGDEECSIGEHPPARA